MTLWFDPAFTRRANRLGESEEIWSQLQAAIAQYNPDVDLGVATLPCI